MVDNVAEANVLPPERFIEKVSLLTGEPIAEPIEPRHLLVQSHRDYHVVDVYARILMGMMVDLTGNQELVRKAMKEVRQLGHKAARLLAKSLNIDKDDLSKRLFGLHDREYYFRYKPLGLSRPELDTRIAELKKAAAAQLAKLADDEGRAHARILVTGGTGFVGKEILCQAAGDDQIDEVVVVVRPKTVRGRATGEILKVHSPADRGRALIRQLWLEGTDAAKKFRFIPGDIEKPNLGIPDDEIARLESTITHLIHCAASVAFDDTYEASFQANVGGSQNALRFSLRLQRAEASPFVSHIGIETSYVHGRQTRRVAREDAIVFPRNFYNNYYELTKAMASLETERFMLDKGLRVTQLCPAIVIGEGRTGNNRGDTKVVNAPVNAFGRAHQTLKDPDRKLKDKSTGWVIGRLANVFPGDPSAELNLIPNDWVVRGILAAVPRAAAAVGERIHLATDNRITSRDITAIVGEEIGIEIKLSEPTLHRTVRLPMLARLLRGLKQDKLAFALEKLGSIFGGYSEWGQPIHEVGNDVRILGLPERRPNTEHAFRMLCRHNEHVLRFGRVRDPDEIARREKIWLELIDDLEGLVGGPAGGIAPKDFRRLVELALDTDRFVRHASDATPGQFGGD